MQILQGAGELVRGNSSLAPKLFGGFLLCGNTGVELVQVRLKHLFQVFPETGKFYAHTNSGIARPNTSCGRDAFLVDPEFNPQ